MKRVILAILAATLIFLLGCTQVQEVQCKVPEDCDKLNFGHERCDGSWNCNDGKCNWECTQQEDMNVEFDVNPEKGLAPLKVSFNIDIKFGNEDVHKKYYCASYEWRFGDGQGTAAIPSCITYEEGKNLPTIYEQSYVYKKPGSYNVEFLLNGEIIATKKIEVNGVDPIYACNTDADCIPQGCSGQICANKNQEMITTCEYRGEYACTKLTSCGCNEGICEWEQNEEYLGCIESTILVPIMTA